MSSERSKQFAIALPIMRTVGWFLLVVVVLLATGVFIVQRSFKPLPGGPDLVALYQQNRDAYEERTAEVRRATLAGERYALLQDKTLGYMALEIEEQPFEVRYHITRSGVGVGTYGAGLAYVQNVPDMLYASMDAMRAAARNVEGFLGYVPIEAEWYFFLWEAD